MLDFEIQLLSFHYPYAIERNHMNHPGVHIYIYIYNPYNNPNNNPYNNPHNNPYNNPYNNPDSPDNIPPDNNLPLNNSKYTYIH